MGEMQKCWIAVACAAHVRRGIEGGFMQVCHGKGGPLKRISPGDGVAYYSPTEAMGDGSPLRAFTAIGIAADRDPYRADMGNGFTPFRRDMHWHRRGRHSSGPCWTNWLFQPRTATGDISCVLACSKSILRIFAA